MHLLINTVLPEAAFTLLGSDYSIIAHEILNIAGAEYDMFLPSLKTFVSQHQLQLQDLNTIYAVTGPASFTGGRIVTLTLGTLSLVHGIPLVGITLFEYWELTGNTYPMAIGINPTEYILMRTADTPMELIAANELLVPILASYHLPRFQLPSGQTGIQLKHTWNTSKLSGLTTRIRSRTLDPLYCKKPNITLSR